MSDSICFEPKNQVRQAWSLCLNFDDTIAAQMKAINKKDRFKLYRDIDKSVTRRYTEKLRQINSDHRAEGLMVWSSEYGSEISNDPVLLNQILIEASNEVISELKI